MRPIRFKIKWVTGVLLTVMAVAPWRAWAVEDAIIAVVNDEIVTLKDLRDYAQSTYMAMAAEGVDEAEMRRVMKDMEANCLRKLIDDKLILSRANEIGIQVREKLLDDRIEEIKKKYPSEKAFMEALVNNGATLGDLRRKVLDQLKIKFVVNHEVRSKVYVSPNEVTEYYERHKKEFQKPERVRLNSIYIPFTDNRRHDLDQAAEAWDQLRKGAPFAEVAKTFSKAPSVGIIERGQMLPEVEKAVFALPLNGISKPIEVKDGIFIFQLVEKFPAETEPLAQVKDKIQNILERQQFQQKMTTWLNKLREDAFIEIK